uniref:Uncharacterized protein n=1 Tax=Panagrolaimus davidi TaxID=227884 RepID=A0A914R1A8_9BILA
MTTMDESMFSKGKQPCFVNDTSGTASNDSQYSNLNLKQAHKCLNGFSPIHSHSKSNSDKYCAAIKIGDKDKEQWKKGGSFEVADNSTLSLHISAYENETAAFDSFGGKNNEALKNNISGFVRSEKKLLTSTFVIQNPFEFPRQQSDKVQDPEVSQFRASQRLLNSNAASKNGQQGSSNSNSVC